MKYFYKFALSIALVSTFTLSTGTFSASANNVRSMVAASARAHGVPVRLAIAVSFQESTHRCHVRGRAGEVGPLQIKPSTARHIGFKGKTSTLLRSCKLQIKWGMKHLAKAYRRGGRKAWNAAYLHNAGLYSRGYKSRWARNYANKIVRRMR